MTSYVAVDEAVTADLIARGGLEATYQHISLLRRKQDLLRASQIAAEEQFLCRIGQLYETRKISEVELAFMYRAYAQFAVSGFLKRWQANISVHPGRIQYILRDLETTERHAPNMADGTWRGSWPLDRADRIPMYKTCVVYVLYDPADEPCYVGSTQNLKARLKDHHKDGKPFLRWTASACPDREAAFQLEEKLLAEHKPYLNRKTYR
jgi:predicted GIY-YIG superfamily endonuclease